MQADPAHGGYGIDLITYSCINTPIVARDGRIYDHSSFEEWSQATATPGGMVTSPWTKQRMGLKRAPLGLLSSPMRRSIPRVSPTPMASGTVTNMLGEIYETIDPLAGLMAELKVPPPCVFVFGNQNSGA
jgi:hypothetical protein